MEQYYLEGNTYVIKNYDKKPPFSSFLPGLAGMKGIPLWVYYTNRGQGINSFGIHNKSNAIMEFNPANTAYENTPLKGFRSFVKCDGDYYEPFLTRNNEVERNLYIKKNSITIEEVNKNKGITIKVKYFVLPKDTIGALVRKIEIINTTDQTKEIELIDGLPKIIPYGIKNGEYKEMSNLLKSWTDIKNVENNAPYYSLRASSDDSAEVSEIEGGYFYCSISKGEQLPVIYDGEAVFGHDTSLIYPIAFLENNLSYCIKKEQYFANKIPCGFTPAKVFIEPRKSYVMHTLTGYAASISQLNERLDVFRSDTYFVEAEHLADEVVEELTKDVKTKTSHPLFDQYVEQCYLDNFLRGGYPFIFNQGKDRSVIHLFSRKHGDPERDYNFFSIAGEWFSQGNGNFRDVNQNRRNDVFFKPQIGDFNIKTFYDLIQIDGYNPLEVRPATFTLKENHKFTVEEFLKNAVKEYGDKLMKVIEKPFTPGQIFSALASKHLELAIDEDIFLEQLLAMCEENIEAGFGEGYWSDHWDYNMDLIEDYLKIFPDKAEELLFLDKTYRFYDSAALVLPRSEKYVMNKNRVRQYGSLIHDEEKASKKDFQKNGTNWLKTKKGSVVTVTLISKLIALSLVKFTTLDPEGMGVEMEGGKPGWNDAMNGLPGLIGSGMPETFELKRMVDFVIKSLERNNLERNILDRNTSISVPAEVNLLLCTVNDLLNQVSKGEVDQFTYWDRVSTAREEFRKVTRFGLDGRNDLIEISYLITIFKQFSEKLNLGIERAMSYGEGIVPTYFTFEATTFEAVINSCGEPILSHYGMQKAKVFGFNATPLPYFLEGPARMINTLDNREVAKDLYHNVKNSDLFDEKLKMYKTSVSIEEISMENGRIRAFTPGWLERESIFLHMEYKYLLGLLKANLVEEFYEEIPNVLIPFLSPGMYGRSILENSSFLASSANPNPEVHGRGYVARLSGSTTELLSMWIEMFMGNQIFTYEEKKLKLHFNPRLPGWMFDEKGEASFTFLSGCCVTYINPTKRNTYGVDAAKISEYVLDSGERIIGNVLSGETAIKVRSGLIDNIKVYMN
ncbi:MAG: hypothetical protein ACK5JH_15670 [Anaerocolumna sp.]